MSEEPTGTRSSNTANAWAPDLTFRYSTDQVLEYAKFLDFIYDRQIGMIRDLLKIVIVRAVAQTMITTGHGCNALSLSESLNIPRETVRRKCDELIKDAWLIRNGDELHPGPSITPEILNMVDENIDRLIGAAEKIENAAK